MADAPTAAPATQQLPPGAVPLNSIAPADLQPQAAPAQPSPPQAVPAGAVPLSSIQPGDLQAPNAPVPLSSIAPGDLQTPSQYLHTQAPADIISSLYGQMDSDPALKAAYASGNLSPDQQAAIKPYQDAYEDQVRGMATGKNPLAAFVYSNSNDSAVGTALKVLKSLPQVAEDVDAATMEHVANLLEKPIGVDLTTGRPVSGEQASQDMQSGLSAIKLAAFQAANQVRQFTNRLANRIYASPLGNTAEGNYEGGTAQEAIREQFHTDLQAKLAEEGITQGSSMFGKDYDRATDSEAVKRMSSSLINPMFLIPGSEGAKGADATSGLAARTLEQAGPESAGLVGTARQAVGKAAALMPKAAAATLRPVAKVVEQNPLVSGVIAAGGSLALKGSPADALMAGLSAAGGGGTKILSKAAEKLETMGGKLSGQIPNGPLGNFAAKVFDTVGEHVNGALTAQLGNTPFLLGSDNQDQLAQNLGFGLVAHSMGYAGGAVANALDIRSNLFSTTPTMPENRTFAKPYGEDPVLDAAHADTVNQLGNSGNNFVQAIRDYLGKSRGELYALKPDAYSNALDAAAQAGHISQATADQGKSQAGISYSAPSADGSETRNIALSKVGQNTPGISVGHEAGHLVWNLLSPDEQQHWKQSVLNTYGVDGIVDYNQKYENLANKTLSPTDAPVKLNLGDTPEEIFAEHMSAVLNSVPIAQFSDPTLNNPVQLARGVYSLAGRAMEKLKLKLPSLNGDVPIGEEKGTTTGTGIEPSAVLGHIAENLLQAHKLDQPLLNGTQQPGEPYVAPAVDSDVPGSQPVAAQPAFKKGDPIDDFRKPGGPVIGTEGKVVKALGPGHVDPATGNFVAGDGEPHYTVEYTKPGNDGERRQGPVPESWLQAAPKAEATTPAGPKPGTVILPKHPVSDATPPFVQRVPTATGSDALGGPKTNPGIPVSNALSPKAASVRSSPEAQNAAFGKQATPAVLAANKALFQKIISDPTKPGAVEIVHNGAPSDVAEPNQIVRERQRLLSEAGGDKQANQKVIVPFKETPSKSDPGVFALDTSKILQNQQLLGQWLKENAGKIALNPALKDSAAYVASPGFKTDLQNYLRNQSNGYGGDGSRVVRPSDTRPGSVPEENKSYSPVKISPEKTNVLNALMGYGLPDTLKQGAAVGNDYFRRFAEGSGRKTSTGALGLAEVNPYRAALTKAGFDPRVLNQAVSQIRYRDIVAPAVVRPDLNVHAGSTGIARAGFMPSVAERTKGEQMESGLRAQGFKIEKEGGAGKYLGTRIEKNGKLIGFIAAEENPKQKSAEILNVHVDPAFRGRGIGEVLYRNLGRNLQDLGVEKVHGSVFSQAAHNLRNKVFGASEESGDLGYKFNELPETWENKSGPTPRMRLDSKIDSDARFMPQPTPENEHATYVGKQEGIPEEGIPSFSLYKLKHDIPGHPKDSTVSGETLTKAGVPVPTAADGHLREFNGATVKDALARPDWAILTATQDKFGPPTSKFNEGANAKLAAELKKLGFPHAEVKGSYEGVDQGKNYLVTGISPEEAKLLGNKYGQDSVLTHRGLEYHDGTIAPADHSKTLVGPAASQAAYHSILPDGTPFTMGFGERSAPQSGAKFMFDLAGIKKMNDEKTRERAEDTFGRQSSYAGSAEKGVVLHSALQRSTAYLSPDKAKTFLAAHEGLDEEAANKHIESYFGGTPGVRFMPGSDDRSKDTSYGYWFGPKGEIHRVEDWGAHEDVARELLGKGELDRADRNPDDHTNSNTLVSSGHIRSTTGSGTLFLDSAMKSEGAWSRLPKAQRTAIENVAAARSFVIADRDGRELPGKDYRAPEVRFMPPADPTKEHVDRAAIKTPLGIFSGDREDHHSSLAKQWRHEHPEEDPAFAPGFISSTGRFLTRGEAMEMARATGQVRKTPTHSVGFGLAAEDFLPKHMPEVAERLPGAVKEKSLSLVHYGQPGMTETDPARFGRSGLTNKAELAGEPRSYFYEAGKENADDPAVSRAHKYTASVSGHDIYDGDRDVLGYKKMVNRQAADEMLQEKGYRGIARSGDGYRQVELYDKQPVTPHEEPVSPAKFMPAQKTESPEFKEWFKDSKVTTPEGKPQLVYHGTGALFKNFDMKRMTQGLIWFTSDKSRIEKGETGAAGKGHIIPLYANIKNPADWAQYGKLGLYEFPGHKLDGAILRDKDGSFDGFVFSPKQLRRAPAPKGVKSNALEKQ
jgi:GNAT superfamily N-acetyltransferase